MPNDAMASIRKLKGRENYDTWKFAVQSYLEHEDLWGAVTGTDSNAKNSTKARAKIILLIEEVNFTHVKETTTAKEAWENLQKAFEDSGLCRRVGLLDVLCNTKLVNCSSVEEYVDKITTAACKLGGIGFAVSDEWVGTLLLFGLPESYKTMIMGIESSGQKITADLIKTKLLQDVKLPSSCSGGESSALVTKSGTKQRWQPRCYSCHNIGHMASKCPNLKSSKGQGDSKRKDGNAFLTSFVTAAHSSSEWYIDSGASAHMTAQSEIFRDNSDRPLISSVTTANNQRLQVQSMGSVCLELKEGNVDVSQVMFVPDLCTNLLSVSQMVKKHNTVIFDVNGCRVLNKSKCVIATATEVNGMYKLDVSTNKCALVSTKSVDSVELWHRRLGHLNFGSLHQLKREAAVGVNFPEMRSGNYQCTSCVKGKQTRLPFKDVATRAKDLLEIVHSDVGGPIECESLGGARYYAVFVDDFSRKVFVFMLRAKSDVVDKFIEFKAQVENQTGKRIKILRTDNGGEYVNDVFDSFLKKSGIRHQLTAPYTPEQNGVAERMNRSIVERARCMIYDANLGKQFWGEAVNTAAYVINRSPCRMINQKTPEEMWSGIKPDLKSMKVFGCMAWVHVPKQRRRKFDAKSTQGLFVGYSETSKAYRIYIPEDKKIVISRDVEFFEKQYFDAEVSSKSVKTNYFDFSPESSESVGVELTGVSIIDDVDGGAVEVAVGDEMAGDSNDSMSDTVEETVVAETSSNVETSDSLASPSSPDVAESTGTEDTFFSLSEDSESVDSDDDFVPPSEVDVDHVNVSERRTSSRRPKPVNMDDYVTSFKVSAFPCDPVTVHDALNGPESKNWIEAMNEEYKALTTNKTWDLVELPPNRKPIQSKWVFKTKRDSSGKVVRYKARLVVKGCSQKPGIDYDETYSPVVRYSSIRMLLAIAAKYDLDIDQMDAVTAFLQGDLEEEIYMVQPEHFVKGAKVCRLKKSLYGLKQASKIWNDKLDGVLKSSGLKQSKVDPCIYYCVNGNSRLYVAVYVDDMLIFTNDQSMKKKLKSSLSTSFNMKDIGEAKSVLGFRITRDRKGGLIWIDQQQYIEEMVAKFNMNDCNPVASPMDINQKLSAEFCPTDDKTREQMQKVPYQAAVGSILFASQVSRPDICYAVNFVSRYNNNPGQPHWTAVKRIIRYLKGTSSTKLQFSKNGNSKLVGYSDADYAGDLDKRRSTTGYIFLYHGGPISWNSRKQPTVALSSTESEYMALASAGQESVWLKTLMQELSMEVSSGVTLNCDNKSAIFLATTTSYQPRTRHIDVKYHYIRELVANKKVAIFYTPTDEMLADVFTKGLAKDKHSTMVRAIGLIN